MSSTVEDFTIGVEEEYQLIHPGTRELRQRAARVLPEAREALGDEVTNELFLSQIEIGTPICRSLAEVRAALVERRRAVIAAAERVGCRVAAAGTHPFSRWERQALTPKPRYLGIADDYRQVVREQVIFGLHVHVGVADRDAAVGAMNRSRPWLATLLALSANSPFWLGLDTGYASYRAEMVGRLPLSGMPHELASRAEYDELVASLVAVGVVQDASKIYWDIRPSSHFETIEYRVADVPPTVDEAVMLAGLTRALARTCHAQHARGEPPAPVRHELLQAAVWRAARHGLDGDLIDVHARGAAPAAERVGALLDFLRPALEDAGDWGEVDALVRRTLALGNGARRQRAAYAQAGRFEDVVDLIVEETARGTA